MSILFFDGFDRCTTTKDLDTNFWSFEPQTPVEYEKYAFGGYSYNPAETFYNTVSYYSYYTPNNAIQPSGQFFQHTSIQSIPISGNTHPGFGQPLGFLALNNLDILMQDHANCEKKFRISSKTSSNFLLDINMLLQEIQICLLQ